MLLENRDSMTVLQLVLYWQKRQSRRVLLSRVPVGWVLSFWYSCVSVKSVLCLIFAHFYSHCSFMCYSNIKKVEILQEGSSYIFNSLFSSFLAFRAKNFLYLNECFFFIPAEGSKVLGAAALLYDSVYTVPVYCTARERFTCELKSNYNT